ncbi:12108_t:CDS:2 [Acaulospora colombiana]|uniref:12108_t:CDS:1 n=1 Tax=Acaulospora colombiana TaxID=27376 RepID=A0ACA9N0E0_9GLOM|nr:12108_t:CDS:2 [Acaulospora colombiana]
MTSKKAPIVYHPSYNIAFWNLEKKYKRIHRILVASGLFNVNSFYEPSPPTPLDLAKLHSNQYLDSLNDNAQLQKILEVPFIAVLPQALLKKKVLEPMLLQTGGSVLAAELALDYGWGINLGDGYALSSVAAPIRLTTSELRTDEKYLQSIQSNIFQSFSRFHPQFIVYNAGTDCLEGDPLGSMNLSTDAILKRDELVFRTAIEHGVPIVMVLSGGYQKKNAEIIATSILNLVNKFGLLKEATSSELST